jgi:hypothetical protein
MPAKTMGSIPDTEDVGVRWQPAMRPVAGDAGQGVEMLKWGLKVPRICTAHR